MTSGGKTIGIIMIVIGIAICLVAALFFGSGYASGRTASAMILGFGLVFVVVVLPLVGVGGFIFVKGRREAAAFAEVEKAVSLAPNSPRNNIFLALALNFEARPEEAIVYAKKAMRLEPYYPAWFLGDVLVVSYDQAGRYEEALAVNKKLLKRALQGEYPLKKAYRRLALCYARLDRMEEARAHAAEFLKIDPNFSVKKWRSSRGLSLFKDQKWLDSGAEMMLKAGLPD